MKFVKGQSPWNKGKKYTEEQRKTLSDAGKKFYENGGQHARGMLGKKHTEETKKIIGLASVGREFSEETRKKLSEKSIGHIAPNKGKTGIFSAETLKKLSDCKIGKNTWTKGTLRSKETKEKISKANKGRKASLETRLKMSGENCHFWKGGISPENEKLRHSLEFRLWREAVFARDNWTCQKTKIRGGIKLHPHHILNFSEYPELRFSVDNGITLSEKSHLEFHKIYGFNNNTKEQIIEFTNIS